MSIVCYTLFTPIIINTHKTGYMPSRSEKNGQKAQSSEPACEHCASINVEFVSYGYTVLEEYDDYVCRDCEKAFTIPVTYGKQKGW